MERLPGTIWLQALDCKEFRGVLAFNGVGSLFCVGAASRKLRGALQSSDHKYFCNFERGDWVYVDGLTNKACNGKYGQVVSSCLKGKGQHRHYSVTVYGIPGDSVLTYSSPCVKKKEWRRRSREYKKVCLPLRDLSLLTPKIMGVRLYVGDEMALLPPDAMTLWEDKESQWLRTYGYEPTKDPAKGPLTISAVRLPMWLSRCNVGRSDSDLLCRAGMALCMHEVEPLCRCIEPNCYMASYLRGFSPEDFVPSRLRPLSCEWFSGTGPHIIFSSDGRDFTTDDMKLLWAFVRFVQEGFGEGRLEYCSSHGTLPENSVTTETLDACGADERFTRLCREFNLFPAHEIDDQGTIIKDVESPPAAERDHDDQGADIENVESSPANEQAAKISPIEAARIVGEMWAGSVERLVETGAHLAPHTDDNASGIGIAVLTFSRASEQLDEAILESPPGRAAIARGVDTRPAGAHGAKFLVDDIGPERLEPPCVPEFNASIVVMYEEEEDALMNWLRSQLPYRKMKRKPDSAGKCIVPGKLSLLSVSSPSNGPTSVASESASSSARPSVATPPQSEETGVLEYTVKYTFIHFRDPRAELSEKAKTA